MSFSGNVKKELCEQISPARHCQIAEISSIFALCGKLVIDKRSGHTLKLQTESSIIAKKAFLLLKQVFSISAGLTTLSFAGKRRGKLYELFVPEEETQDVLSACKLHSVPAEGKGYAMLAAEAGIAGKTCCKRSFLRGAFLVSGSVTDPKKAYHLEFTVSEEETGTSLCEMLRSFGLDAKMIPRKSHFVVYIKEGEQIVDLLNIMGAHVALMEYENVRILKDVRNTINRKVNCEAANLSKTAKAAARQLEDIQYIRDTMGFELLAEGLKEIAMLRIEYPEASLKELGEMLNPPVGKSGVNHRLKRLCDIAEQRRPKQGQGNF